MPTRSRCSNGSSTTTCRSPAPCSFEGAPGIGKTSLLRALLEMARRREYAVAICQPTRSEMDLSYAGLVGLLDDLGLATVDALPAPQAQVLRTILRLEDSAQTGRSPVARPRDRGSDARRGVRSAARDRGR